MASPAVARSPGSITRRSLGWSSCCHRACTRRREHRAHRLRCSTSGTRGGARPSGRHTCSRLQADGRRSICALRDRRRSVAGADVGQRDGAGSVPAARSPVAERVLRAHRRIVPNPSGPGDGRQLYPDGGDVLIDGHTFHVRARFACVAAGVVDPPRMMDRAPLECRVAAVEHIVQFEAGVSRVVPALRIAVPVRMTQWRKSFVGGVQLRHLVAGQCRRDDEIRAGRTRIIQAM